MTPRRKLMLAWACVLIIVLAVIAVFATNARAASKPTLLLIHGGGWVTGSSAQTAPWADALRAQGYPVVNAHYRLAGAGVTGEEQLNDLARQIPRNRIVIAVGFSAGGNLALLLAQRGVVSGVVAFSAPTKLTASSAGLAPYAETFAGCPISACRARWNALSPTHLTTPAYLAYGAHETLVPPSQGDDVNGARVIRVPGSQHSGADYAHGWERALLAPGLAYVTQSLTRGGKAVA